MSFIVGDSSMRIFANSPSDESDMNMGTYWTGNKGHYLQHKNALIALYDIPQNMHYQFIHAFVPRNLFEEVVEKDGWIFVRYGDVAAGLRFSSPYHWTQEGRFSDTEVISDGNQHALVCEVRNLKKTSFEAFMSELLSNKVSFDPEAMELSYSSKAEGLLSINTSGKREYNGKAVDLDYPSMENPYAYSKWDSGLTKFNYNGQTLLLSH